MHEPWQHPRLLLHPSKPKSRPSGVRKQVWLRSVLTLKSAASFTSDGRSLSQNRRTKSTVRRSYSSRRGAMASAAVQASANRVV